MIKEITVAGIKLDNYSVRESMMMLEKALSTRMFTVIEEVNMNMLLLAKENAVVKEAIEAMDMAVIADVDILKAVEEPSLQRKLETEEKAFFFQLMKRLDRNKKSVFLLGETEKEIMDAEEYIKEEFPHILIVGKQALESNKGATEGIINNINMITPDVIISVLPTPLQEAFLVEHRGMISTNLWYGIGQGRFCAQKHSLKMAILKWFRSKKLMEYIRKDVGQEETEHEDF